jgi:hypothetical protein
MSRRLLVVLLGCLAVVVGSAAPASAGPPVTSTETATNVVETFADVVPTCEGEGGPLYVVTVTSNVIEHETVFDDGRVHATFTQAGKVSAVPMDPTLGLPSYTGQLAVWGGFNANGAETNSTFTFNLKLTGSDGSKVSQHSVEHSDQRPDGTVHEFFRCH